MGRTLPTTITLLACAALAPTHAACPAANQYNFSFAAQTAATLSYASSYTYTGVSTALGNQNFTVDWTTDSVASSIVSSQQTPAISNLITDGVAARNLVVGGTFTGRTPNDFATRFIATRLTFAVPVRDLTFQLNDIDLSTSSQFRDWLRVTGFNGAANYNPALATPHGTNNSGGPLTNASSSMTLGPTTTPYTITVREGLGVGSSGNNANTGTVTASFVQPVTQVEIRYGNYVDGGPTGQQGIGLQSITWCPMPAVTMAKSVAPWSDPQNGTTSPKLVPGGDAIYTLTVSNANASSLATAELPAITDVLASTLTYFNGDIDDTGPLTTNFEFLPGSSGVTLAPAGVGYSNNSGASYGYTPSAGYDAAVNALRFAPGGTMAANSSFQIKFRVRIK